MLTKAASENEVRGNREMSGTIDSKVVQNQTCSRQAGAEGDAHAFLPRNLRSDFPESVGLLSDNCLLNIMIMMHEAIEIANGSCLSEKTEAQKREGQMQ
jgi:hypothetical protein